MGEYIIHVLKFDGAETRFNDFQVVPPRFQVLYFIYELNI